MKCPIDSSDLVMSDRQGVEIDYCPQCRGVWLDRGEIDKIVERSSAPVSQSEPRYERAPEPRREEYRDSHSKDGHHRKHKRESFIGDLFDF